MLAYIYKRCVSHQAINRILYEYIDIRLMALLVIVDENRMTNESKTVVTLT